MTAINIILTDRSAHLYCDTMGSVGGQARSQVVKCLPVPHLNVAVATRGQARALPAVHTIISNFESFSDLRSGIAGSVQLSAGGTDSFFRPLRGEVDIFVIAFDSAPRAFALFTHANHGHEPWKPIDIKEGVITPTIPQQDLDQLAVGGMHPSVGFNAIGIQADLHPGVVGGTIQETIVDRSGVRTRSVGIIEPAHRPVFRQAVGSPSLPAAFARHLRA